jgi:hypothetical protein
MRETFEGWKVEDLMSVFHKPLNTGVEREGRVLSCLRSSHRAYLMSASPVSRAVGNFTSLM